MLSDMLSDILSGHSIWHYIYISHSIWHSIWHSTWHTFWHFNTCYPLFYLACYLGCHLAYIMTARARGGPECWQACRKVSWRPRSTLLCSPGWLAHKLAKTCWRDLAGVRAGVGEGMGVCVCARACAREVQEAFTWQVGQTCCFNFSHAADGSENSSATVLAVSIRVFKDFSHLRPIDSLQWKLMKIVPVVPLQFRN